MHCPVWNGWGGGGEEGGRGGEVYGIEVVNNILYTTTISLRASLIGGQVEVPTYKMGEK